MKEFIEKLITRIMLESASCKVYKLINPNKEDIAEFNAYKKCIEIVNELAEKYKDKLDDEWQIIYNKILNLEKKYANDGNTESVNDCIKLENLLQYFKEELRSEEEYINTSTDTSSGWVACSERLPPQPKENPLFEYKPLEVYLVSLSSTDYPWRAFWNGKYFTDGFSKVEPIAWMPLPAPYKEGCE